jgi:leucyl/phenylalanyl-tRNA--protein transferase
MHILTNEIKFPLQRFADEDGLLAIGGDLSMERLLFAYRNGIFPWYNEGEVIQWYCPNPRFVLFPEQLKISKSMQKFLRSNTFTYTYNTAFKEVIQNCSSIKRVGQSGTWIHPEIIKAYTTLNKKGYAISAEAWQHNKLVGGLYGIMLGNVFFGESMFSHASNASKFAFINFIQQKPQIKLIDCQVYTAHLESLGATMISRKIFLDYLKQLIPQALPSFQG